MLCSLFVFFFFFQAEDGIRDGHVTGVQTCALPISSISNSAGISDATTDKTYCSRSTFSMSPVSDRLTDTSNSGNLTSSEWSFPVTSFALLTSVSTDFFCGIMTINAGIKMMTKTNIEILYKTIDFQ